MQAAHVARLDPSLTVHCLVLLLVQTHTVILVWEYYNELCKHTRVMELGVAVHETRNLPKNLLDLFNVKLVEA